eukprot:5143230-Pyramimonas_sp.AAC.1
MQIARVSYRAYRGARFISLGGLLHGPHFATHGVVAGCSIATSYVRVYIIPTVDPIRLPTQVSLDIHIDDYGLSSSGTSKS